MNTASNFAHQWKERFHLDSVPVLNCLSDNISREGVELEINKHLIQKDKLLKELEQEEFVIQFLKTLHASNEHKDRVDSTKNQGDSQVNLNNSIEEVESRHERKSSNSSITSLDSDTADNVMKRSQKAKPIPAPRPSLHVRQLTLIRENSIKNANIEHESSSHTDYGINIIRAPVKAQASLQETATASTEHKEEERIYDDPIILATATGKSDESSDDEENNPVYWNVLVMKHKHWSLGSQLYATVEKGNGSKATRSTMPPLDVSPSTPTSSQKKEESRASFHDDLNPYAQLTDVDIEQLDTMVPSYPEAGSDTNLAMRRLVIKSVMESEHQYIAFLNILIQYEKALRAVVGKAQQILNNDDIDTIFFHTDEICAIHGEFVNELKPCLDNWTPSMPIGLPFKMLAFKEYPIAKEYLANYPRAVAAVKRCCETNPEFQKLVSGGIKIVYTPSTTEKPSVEELLHKPVVRFQRNTLVLHDLIRFTPTSHQDYDILQKTLRLAQDFLGNFSNTCKYDTLENHRYFVKQAPIVEKIGDVRKLRQVILFNDVLVCCKQTLGSGKKIQMGIKWFVSLLDLTIEDFVSKPVDKLVADKVQRDVDALQKSIADKQSELMAEKKLATQKQSTSQTHKKVDKIKRKLIELEQNLILISPSLTMSVKNEKSGKTYLLMMSSDYERTSWRDSILGLKTRVAPNIVVTANEVQAAINNLKQPLTALKGSLFDQDELLMEQEHLFGTMSVTIHRLNGLSSACDTLVHVEVDTFGHFNLKAKTKVAKNKVEPSWNQEFDVDLDGAQTLRFLGYKVVGDQTVLLGKCALELSRTWLQGDYSEKTISLNDEMSVTVSLKYTGYSSRDQTIGRRKTTTLTGGAIFGVMIEQVTKREGTQVPAVITACVEEIERRGIDDVGIYRVSGLSADVQALKKLFEKNLRAAKERCREEPDINVLTSLVKLYFRELPEALFTDALYSKLLEGITLNDPEAREQCMIALFNSLPEPNFSVAQYLILHLIKVAAHENLNKMSTQNLATVFGPTLLHPAAKDGPVSIDLFVSSARDCMMQTNILCYFMEHFQCFTTTTTKHISILI